MSENVRDLSARFLLPCREVIGGIHGSVGGNESLGGPLWFLSF
jgi:hypothetical protein